MISVPVISAGIRSGVNWMRLKDRFSVRLSVLIISVLARPGTPSSKQCPRLKSEISSSSITCVLADDHFGQLLQDLLAGWPSWRMAERLALMGVVLGGHARFLVRRSVAFNVAVSHRVGATGGWVVCQRLALINRQHGVFQLQDRQVDGGGVDRADVALVPRAVAGSVLGDDAVVDSCRGIRSQSLPPSRYFTWA